MTSSVFMLVVGPHMTSHTMLIFVKSVHLNCKKIPEKILE